MEKTKAKAVMEAVLFTMGESVEIHRLAELIGEDLRTTKKILREMAEEYAGEGRGIALMQFEDAVQLSTKPEYYEYLIQIAKTPRKVTLTE